MQRIALPNPESAEAELVDRVATALGGGGLIIYPTETLYALGCDPRLGAALEALVRLKQRPAAMQVPLVAAGLDQVEQVSFLRSPRERLLAERFWPGPLTLVLPRRPGAPLASWFWGETLALRVPGSPLARALAAALGSPLPSTSANLSGEAAASRSADLSPELLAGVDLLLDAGDLRPSPPSTIVQITDDSWRLLREGVVPAAELIALLGPPEPPRFSGPG